MTMPKGFKSPNGYATISELGGKSYQQIADSMSEMGFKMNHSTARNICVESLKKIARSILDINNMTVTDKELKRIAKDPGFQSGICDIIKETDSKIL
jgi:hypothetical protein